MYVNMLCLVFVVPFPEVSILPFSSIEGAMVGSPQEIHCIVSTVSGVDPRLVSITWMGPGGDTITNDSRVNISPITLINDNYISTIEFTYLLEGDEGVYTCNVTILETKESDYTEIKKLSGEWYSSAHLFELVEIFESQLLPIVLLTIY